MRHPVPILLLSMILLLSCRAGQEVAQSTQSMPSSRQIADSFIQDHPGAVTYDSGSPSQKWNYEQGLMLVGLYQLWKHTGNRTYLEFVQNNLDHYITENGDIQTYSLSELNCDNIAPGRALLEIYNETKLERYKIAADTLRQQIRRQPRTNEGGFWHKKIYPYQMWLDGLFMVEPFYAMYARQWNEPEAFDDITNQFIWVTSHTLDKHTGLLYHAWDESKQQKWANPETGCSPSFWGRSMGWYAMALVDVLDYLPENHPKRTQLIGYLRNWAKAILKFRDANSKLWYQVVDQGAREKNYLEASSSCMFAYAFAKGVRKGYLNPEFRTAAQETYAGLCQKYVTKRLDGGFDLDGTCGATGLGGNPYRDGSYEYYTGVPRLRNDKRGVGAFLLLAIELEKATGKE